MNLQNHFRAHIFLFETFVNPNHGNFNYVGGTALYGSVYCVSLCISAHNRIARIYVGKVAAAIENSFNISLFARFFNAILIKAARAGKHIFTEKALCPTVAECEEVKKAIKEAGVTFVISYPQRGRPSVLFAKEMIARGMFGKITLVRMRDAHAGVSGNWLPDYWFEKKDAAGGAMMDLGCHPMYLLAYFLGKPKRVTGMFTAPYGKPVDENAVAIAEFDGGALGVAETAFVSYNSPQTLEIYGTEGSMIAHGEDVQFSSAKLAGIKNGFMKPDLPQAKPAPILQFVDACINGTGSPEGLGIDDAIALTELLENAYIGDENAKIVEL